MDSIFVCSVLCVCVCVFVCVYVCVSVSVFFWCIFQLSDAPEPDYGNVVVFVILDSRLSPIGLTRPRPCRVFTLFSYGLFMMEHKPRARTLLSNFSVFCASVQYQWGCLYVFFSKRQDTFFSEEHKLGYLQGLIQGAL